MILKIYKKSLKVWEFIDENLVNFIPSKFSINTNENFVTIILKNGAESRTFNVSEIELYNVGSATPYPTFASVNDFMLKLEGLNCPCFFIDREYVFLPNEWISNDAGNILTLGTDNKFYTPNSGGGGGIQSVVAGTNVSVDNTDPLKPIVSASAILVTTLEMNALTPTLGQQVYNTDTNSFWYYNGTEWVVVGSTGTGLEIIDSTPSAIITTPTPTLVKEYDLGVFTGKKLLLVKSLIHKIVNEDNVSSTITLRLFNGTSELQIYQNTAVSIVSGGIENHFILDNGLIKGVDRNATSFTGDNFVLNNTFVNITETAIDFSLNYKLRVYLNVNTTGTSGMKQYYGQINLK